jgi:acyl-CoA synthetase (AMP-forming)/AMP-acid ligase II
MNILIDILELPLALTPDHEILVSPQESLTYADLAGAAAGWERKLEAQGVGADDIVVLMSTNRPAAVAAMLGAWSLGACVCMLTFRASAPEAADVIASTGAAALVVAAPYEDLAQEALAGRSEVSLLVLDPDDIPEEAEEAERPRIVERAGEGPALVILTSGSTGKAKPAVLTHAALHNIVEGHGGPLAPGDPDPGTNLIVVPLYHVAGLSSLLGCLAGGRRAALLESFDPAEWVDAVCRWDVTHAFVVPTILYRLLEAPEFATEKLPSLQILTYGGAPAPAALIIRALADFPDSVGFVNSYGLTESGATVSYLDPDDHRRVAAGEHHLLASVGRAVPGVEIAVVDEAGGAMPARRVGEVLIATQRAMRGYLGAEGGERWLHSGDLGYLDDEGYLFLQGRADELIIRGGENIYPREVEEALLGHPAVEECAVLGIPDEEWGQRVGALVVSAVKIDAEELTEHLRGVLTRNKKPDEFVFIDAIPRTETGKVRRRDALELLTTALQQEAIR